MDSESIRTVSRLSESSLFIFSELKKQLIAVFESTSSGTV
eukprot:UN32942